MTPAPGLTPYARAHLRLCEINRRLEQVLRKRPDSVEYYEFSRAPTEARYAIQMALEDQMKFDLLVHRTNPTLWK